jgi:inositol phosphorylceramide mannosyltransferase catalytic subunit
MLWTDASSREFIAEHYPWFLDTFDGYVYPIQRADAIRYFVLHHYGGVYMDLDIGCNRPLDPLLVHSVILPKTIPVGVSNDLMFSEKSHPFMAQTIHNLVTFDHSWILNYPTVMFSTGPMFLSIQYGLYSSSHPAGSYQSYLGEVRILPKSLYGKNAKPEEAPDAFFEHFYGSSWHSDDAAFIGFLGSWGKRLMIAGLVVLVLGLLRLALPSSGKSKRRHSRMGSYYHVIMPRWSQTRGLWYVDPERRNSTYAERQASEPLQSPVSSLEDEEIILSSIPIRVRSASPSLSESTDLIPGTNEIFAHPAVNTVWRAGSRILESIWGSREQDELPGTPSRSRRRGRNALQLPTVFTQSQDTDASSSRRLPRMPSSVQTPPPRYASPTPDFPPEKQRSADGSEGLAAEGSRASQGSSSLPSYPGRATPQSESTATSYFMTPGVQAFPGPRTPTVSRPPSRNS